MIYVVIFVLIGISVIMFVGVVVARNKRTGRLLVELGEFARQVRGVEHHGGLDTRPSFGHFPDEGASYRPVPFDYAIEFRRSGIPVVAFEKRTPRPDHGGTRASAVAYESYVEVPAAAVPPLWIGPELTAMQNLELRALIVPELSTGRHHRRLVVCCPDPDFARAIITPGVLPWLTERLGPWVSPIVVEHGTVRTKVRQSERLTADNILPTADLLIEFLRFLPRLRVQ